MRRAANSSPRVRHLLTASLLAVSTLAFPSVVHAAPATCWSVAGAPGTGEPATRLTISGPDGTLRATLLTPMSTATLTGSRLHDHVELRGTVSRVGREVDVSYQGDVAGETMRGTTTMGERTAPFVATIGCSGDYAQPMLNWSTAPKKLDFDDHEGFVSIFDGTLDGWDGNPKFWRAEGGMIVGESSRANPSGNAYLTYRKMIAHDFDLRMEIKLEHGGSGIQYRSHTGIPWRSAAPPAVVANVGPYDPKWMLTGPQADFWGPNSAGSFAFNGQVYSENTPIGIEAFLGQVVRSYGEDIDRKKLVGTIASSQELTGFVNINGWNQYEVIARGGVFIHIMNGRIMAVLVDDDPKGGNQLPGYFGLEIEGETKVLARKIFVHKIN